MAEWLRTLSTITNGAEDPLRIVRIVRNKEPHIGAVEVPLSYDLVTNYGFSERMGRFNLIINGSQLTGPCWRATNGNCLLPFDEDVLEPGTNSLQVWFMINNPTDVDHFLWATGPTTPGVLGTAAVAETPTNRLSQ
jgi:hypothetical protein